MHPADAFYRFQKHSITLLRASSYLLRAEILVLQESGELREMHRLLLKGIGNTYQSPHDYFMSRLFISHVSAFEIFLQEITSSVVSQHPMKLGSFQFRLSDILQVEDKSFLVQRAIEQTLNSLMYKKPSEYRDSLSELLSVELRQFDPQWRVFIEAKARRDLGVHADWQCNATYLRKLNEAGIAPQLSENDSAIPDTDQYLGTVADALIDLAEFMTALVLEKHFGVSAQQYRLRTGPAIA